LAAVLWGGLAGGGVANLGSGDWVAALGPFHGLSMAGESLLFTSAILFGLNLYWVIGCPFEACCPKTDKEEEKIAVEAEKQVPEEKELTEEEEAAKKSMGLTVVIFVLTTILVIAFAGVVFSLIL
jgi:uncharacterized membrane protein YkgB